MPIFKFRRRSDGTLFPLSYIMNDAVSLVSQDSITAPALVLLLVEEDDKSLGGDGANDGRFVPRDSPIPDATRDPVRDELNKPPNDKVAGVLSERHMKGGNYFYTDGHAKWSLPRGIQNRAYYQLPWSPDAKP